MSASSPKFGPRLRASFLLERGTAFLNHGSFGTAPRRVLAAQERWRRRMEANPDRFMRLELPAALRASASRLAAFVGARGEDLVFVENATTAVSSVLQSLRLRRGDEIVASSHTYGAVRNALRHLCARTGAKLVEARISLPVANEADLVAPIERAFTRRTRLLVLDHIASPTGLVFPVRRLAAFARRRGAQVLVDGAHAPGQIALDIPALGVDWYTGNAHKWLCAPKGSAFLWTHPRAQADLHALQVSHGYGKGLAAEFDWPGTRDFSGWLAVPDALDFLASLGPAQLRRRNHALVTGAARALARAWGTECDGPPGLHGSMMAVRLPDAYRTIDPVRLMHRWISRDRVVAPVMAIDGAPWVRISAQAYNGPADYERLARLVTSRSIP